MSILVVSFLVAAIVLYIRRYYAWVARYPAGPKPYPLIGNIRQMASKPLSFFADQFNGMYTIFGPNPTLEITDYSLIKEAFIDHGEDYVDRQQSKGISKVFSYCENGGVINSSGDNWREQRRVSLSILRDFGMGKNVMEELVRNSVSEYLLYLKSVENKESVNLRWPIQVKAFHFY